MFLFEKDEENLWIDFESVRRVVNDLCCCARGGAGRNEITISDALGEDFVGETDKVTVLDVIMYGGVPGGFVGFPVVAVAVVVEEFVDFRDGHRLVVAHRVVGNDVAWAEIGERGGFGVVRKF